MTTDFSKADADRDLLLDAQDRGIFSTLFAFFRLSGPGWLQSAITLGGGSLTSALYLGVLGGWSMLWLQLVAITIGVIMLSAISYVSLSTGKRPYQAINEHVNPVLGVGWVTATILANLIWCMPQYSLCFDILDKNLLPDQVDDVINHKIIVSVILFVITSGIVFMSIRGGLMAKLFDWILKLLVGMVVICFVAVVVQSARTLDWNSVFSGFIPNLLQWNNLSPSISGLIDTLPEQYRDFWANDILANQRSVMISTTATAVGINMTFLLPYSMLNRGWDRPFRGLATFDLITGMAIPYILVTTCIVIASANSFHAKADKEFLSASAEEFQTSGLFGSAKGLIEKRILKEDELALDEVNAMPSETDDEKKAKTTAKNQKLAEFAVSLSENERKVAAALVKPNTQQLAKALEPLLGERMANLAFGIGAFGMGFSTIIILMLINGYAVSEVLGLHNNTAAQFLGCLLAGIVGACWPWMWDGASKTWLGILASTFGAMLLPIAYVAFFAMMNSSSLLGDQKPRGIKMIIWNILMIFGVVGAFAQAVSAVSTKIKDPMTGQLVIGGAITFVILAVIGFSARPKIVDLDHSEE